MRKLNNGVLSYFFSFWSWLVFLEKLFEQEIPEVFDGLITIKKAVRIPGEKAKVAVDSYDDRIDPVGACVGMRGSRVQTIVNELHGEKIDIINFQSL